MKSGAILFKITQETTREKERGKEMKTVKSQEANIERCVKEVSNISNELNGLLENQDFDKASDLVMKIETVVNYIKYLDKLQQGGK
jgi:hypothetical protein